MRKEYQLDIFGNEIETEKIFEIKKKIQHGGRIPKKSLFRSMYGYNKGFYCKNCRYFKVIENNRRYFKCQQLGITNSTATDIRKNDIACNLYEEY